MAFVREFVVSAFIGGVLVLLPLYLSVLLLLKLVQSVMALVAPIATLLPAWLPERHSAALLGLVLICFLVGAALRVPAAHTLRESIERRLLGRLPGYMLFRSVTQRLAGRGSAKEWKPALAEIEEALVPAFVVEELDDGRLTVFVPSVPTPLAGAVYILTPDRVHLIDVPFTQAIRTVTQWGSGARDLVAAMKPESVPSAPPPTAP